MNTLDKIHQELDTIPSRVAAVAEDMAEEALLRLDTLVLQGNRRQRRRPRTVREIEQRRAWNGMLEQIAQSTLAAHAKHLRIQEVLDRLPASGRGGLVTFPVVQRDTRTYDEQKRLYDRWQARKNPDGIAFPGPPSHHMRGVAIDLGDSESDPTWFDNAGRPIRDFAEPWHFEYRGGPLKHKSTWRLKLELRWLLLKDWVLTRLGR